MHIAWMNKEIKNDIFYDRIFFGNIKKNFPLLISKLVYKIFSFTIREKFLDRDLRNKSVVRLFLLTLNSTILLSGILFSPFVPISATAFLVGASIFGNLIIAIYDVAYRRFYNEEYLLKKIKKEPEFFKKADPELKTNLGFIWKALSTNEQVFYEIPNCFLDASFLLILQKNKINIPSLVINKPIIDKFYYSGLRNESIPSEVSLVTGTASLEILPEDALNEILKWLSIASSTRFSITSKKINLLIDPFLTIKINTFFLKEVHQIITGIQIYGYALDNSNNPVNDALFVPDLTNCIDQLEGGKLDVSHYRFQCRPLWNRHIQKLQAMIDSDFNDLSQEISLPNFSRIEKIKMNILFVCIRINNMEWGPYKELMTGKNDPLALMLELIPCKNY